MPDRALHRTDPKAPLRAQALPVVSDQGTAERRAG